MGFKAVALSTSIKLTSEAEFGVYIGLRRWIF